MRFPDALVPRAALTVLAVVSLALGCSRTPKLEVSFADAFAGVAFERPVDLAPLPGGGWLLADQGGRVVELASDGSTHDVLDLKAAVSLDHQEEGLLSLALDPSFAANRRLWLYYTAGDPLLSVVARFTVGPDPATTRASEIVVLEIPQPYQNHNGGALRFGPDGMLYLGVGDGGDAWDPLGTGQDRGDLLGSVIRIDVRASTPAEPYRIPPDNPFVDDPGSRPELWTYGMRNPWRMAFDPATGDLWAADVGQHDVEEIDLIRPGRNYGWNTIEGDRCLAETCDGLPIEPPLLTYDHGETHCAVTGGVVYRGGEIPALAGRYLYADLCSGTLWAADTESGRSRTLATLDASVVSFVAGPDGEVYLLQFGGPILRLLPGRPPGLTIP